MSLGDQILQGDRLALARLLTQIENEAPEGLDALGALFAHTGRAHVVGITGAPGTGKSTLVNQLARYLRRAQAPRGGESPRVAVIAVDPSSPFTGGAILGDRVRMRDLAGDEGIFIRSMASRGALGGLARTTADVALALDAAGYQIILIETVGAGQAEVDIASTAHTTIVIDAPGLGDEIQANKAGLLEIADVLVVNKADLPGAENAAAILRMALEYSRGEHPPTERDGWEVPVLTTVATTGEGVPELAEAVHRHRDHLVTTGAWEARERHRIRTQMENLLRERLMERFLGAESDGRFDRAVEEVLARRCSPAQAVADLLAGE